MFGQLRLGGARLTHEDQQHAGALPGQRPAEQQLHSWPGQALSYKLGEITIMRLRREAEAALGPKFDVRAFHDAVLAQGSVPLPVLETQVRAWVAAAKAK